jgi:hypothetical protein
MDISDVPETLPAHGEGYARYRVDEGYLAG